ncbi:hypothetical protein DFH06DRAFT_1144057 [Mycena polygramma]|nr:hypothetical protein DFH06DRAFT_1144057 [Mycena polygramma]
MSPRGPCKAANLIDDRTFMLRIYSSSYHARHREERNAKTRARMASIRDKEATLPAEEKEARKEARREAARRYRQKNAERLAQKARDARSRARAAGDTPRVGCSAAARQGVRALMSQVFVLFVLVLDLPDKQTSLSLTAMSDERALAVVPPQRHDTDYSYSSRMLFVDSSFVSRRRETDDLQNREYYFVENLQHDFIGDLQRGERYMNLDYVFATNDVRHLFVTYDTPCPLSDGEGVEAGWGHLAVSRDAARAMRWREQVVIRSQERQWAFIAARYWNTRTEAISRSLIEPSPALIRHIDAAPIERTWYGLPPPMSHFRLTDGARSDMAPHPITMMGPGVRHDTLEDHLWTDGRRGAFPMVLAGQSYGGGQLTAFAAPETAGASWARQWLESHHIDSEEAAAAWAGRPENRRRLIRYLCGIYIEVPNDSFCRQEFGWTALRLFFSFVSVLDRLPLGDPDGAFRCLPPWHPDNPNDKRGAARKLYLATGPTLGQRAGAYNSWNSANAVVSGASGATAPSFGDWTGLVDAWQGGCGRGEHGHPVDPAVQRIADGEGSPQRRRGGAHLRSPIDLSPRAPQTASPLASVSPSARRAVPAGAPSAPKIAKSPGPSSERSRIVAATPSAPTTPITSSLAATSLTATSPTATSSAYGVPAATSSASSTSTPRSLISSARSRARAPTTPLRAPLPATLPVPSAADIPDGFVPLGPRTYAIRWSKQGVVCGSPEDAEKLYRELEDAGALPRMLSTWSFADAACFAEGFSPALPAEEADLRAQWIASQPPVRVRVNAGERERERRRRVVAEAYALRGEEELARLRQRVARLEAELAGKEWTGSSSFESLDEEAAEREEEGYESKDTDDIVSEVEARKGNMKNWRLECAAVGGSSYRKDDAFAHTHRR